MAVPAKASKHLRDQVIFTHQAGYPMAATAFTLSPQGIEHPRITISFSSLFVYVHDLVEQGLIRCLARTLCSFLPGVITAPTDTQLPAQNGGRALCSVFVYEPEAIYFFSGNSFSALRSTLFSWRTLASSFSNCLIFFCASSNSLFERAF